MTDAPATPHGRSNSRILTKALELFSEKGYDATSVREICEAAGVTKPTLYHFYGSKEGVYRAIVEGALDRFRAEMLGSLNVPGSLRDRLVRMARTYIESTAREPELARFIMALIHMSPRSAPATDFVGFYESILAELARTVDAAVAAGEIGTGPTQVRMLVFMGALGEAMHGHLLVGRPELTPQLPETLVDTVLLGWAAPPSPNH
ncbi:MAG TPA: TetR/AcrR family transcriptional regulator [Vicinamibacteria bacterium]|nr:TetR/AcrR family transcriptional regulator [Vicinamibacteria bacterium]